ncbi:hypothetical protein C4552_03545 [Candidatus Parcubacteria bacterium]|nr:MAG: hypothetical protein C4552_03545 [Candidatus Parcubacteria bacterium]
MNTPSFWKIFAVVFVVAFAANVVVAYLWSVYFHGSGWQWDATTTTAAIIGLAAAYIMHRKNSN